MCRNGNGTGDRTGRTTAHSRDGAASSRGGPVDLNHPLMIADGLQRNPR